MSTGAWVIVAALGMQICISLYACSQLATISRQLGIIGQSVWRDRRYER